ncbi:pyrroloquinoline quinone biosynthesis protein PqqF [Pseudomonas syringae]|uniref:Coenzyme PQQ synthesis protein F n=1 Tax=Pseudomonas syringae TaxID=317 RepID=A0A085VHH4_PSESX|nr:pyrroloquinoline quinone biosynthesis protein PqqF [Pseudomonas syringae]KFE54887.1 peptidase M16 [Pseudomonas syringae]
MPRPSTQHLTLANGLNVVLCHAPRLKRCAASLRVAAGSHDVPAAWPGLAHFLEHLFFLGTERFADDEKLMRFVQRHGGQINASTRERTTDFFFELPVASFAQGLERLCDMLSHPRMTLADQLREREVLHAEFIAWSRDAASRQQTQRLQGLSARHPLRGFHAGNRYSLRVPDQAFQQALQDFYQRFYQAGQMTLCLSGPQSLEELRALATGYGGYFAAGEKVEQDSPPRLIERGSVMPCDLFAFEGLPAGADEAVAFLCHAINGSRAEGVGALKAEVVYQFAGQALISVANKTAIAGKRAPTDEMRASVGARLPAIASTPILDWFQFFKTTWPTLRTEYNRLSQRRLETAGPLDLAHHYARTLPLGLSAQGCVALTALLEHLQPETQTATIDWQLPKPNPFLSAVSDGTEGAVYLRWQLQYPQPALWQRIEQSLRQLTADAKQAGVDLAFTAYGNYWQLKLCGIAAPIPDILEHVFALLNRPDDEPQSGHNFEPPLIPIRQLLKVLPDRYLSAEAGAEITDITRLWASTRWISFISGSLNCDAALNKTPGVTDARPMQVKTLAAGKHWQAEHSDSSENAVLLFCSTPTSSIADEAIWRLLAQLVQGPFYQRLRVELQLGYAVFSGFRQIAGQSGLLFGVQSPSASAEALVRHIEGFLGELPRLLEEADLSAQTTALIAQLDTNGMDNASAAELFWQARLAGRDADYLPRLMQALGRLQAADLSNALASLNTAAGGWLCLTNSLGNPWANP